MGSLSQALMICDTLQQTSVETKTLVLSTNSKAKLWRIGIENVAMWQTVLIFATVSNHGSAKGVSYSRLGDGRKAILAELSIVPFLVRLHLSTTCLPNLVPKALRDKPFMKRFTLYDFSNHAKVREQEELFASQIISFFANRGYHDLSMFEFLSYFVSRCIYNCSHEMVRVHKGSDLLAQRANPIPAAMMFRIEKK